MQAWCRQYGVGTMPALCLPRERVLIPSGGSTCQVPAEEMTRRTTRPAPNRSSYQTVGRQSCRRCAS